MQRACMLASRRAWACSSMACDCSINGGGTHMQEHHTLESAVQLHNGNQAPYAIVPPPEFIAECAPPGGQTL